MIRKLGTKKFRLYGRRSGKHLGDFPSRVQAEKHERQIMFFMYGKKRK